jgi:ribosome-binding factor A
VAGSTRLERVAEQIQREVGKMLVRGEIKDPRIGLVTVTGAKVSPDLREAWVYWSVHGDLRRRQETATGLDAARGFIRRGLGKVLRLRATPDVHFVFDEAIERGDRIEQLLKAVHELDRQRAEESSPRRSRPEESRPEGPGDGEKA